MKSIRIIWIFSLVILFACSQKSTDKSSGSSTAAFDTTSLAAGSQYYQCPMHPAVLSEKAGECPDCGMALEPRVKQ